MARDPRGFEKTATCIDLDLQKVYAPGIYRNFSIERGPCILCLVVCSTSRCTESLINSSHPGPRTETALTTTELLIVVAMKHMSLPHKLQKVRSREAHQWTWLSLL